MLHIAGAWCVLMRVVEFRYVVLILVVCHCVLVMCVSWCGVCVLVYRMLIVSCCKICCMLVCTCVYCCVLLYIVCGVVWRYIWLRYVVCYDVLMCVV